jgi:parallel beta-helix repeat protein
LLVSHQRLEEPGAKVDIQFFGTGISLVYFVSYDHGIAEIDIDGTPYSSIDMYGSEQRCKVEKLIAADLAPSEHVLTITVSGEKNPSSTNTFIVVDAVNVIPFDLSTTGANVVLGSVYAQPPAPSVKEHAPTRTLLVPSDYQSIQTAIDSAKDGDIIVVAPGIYQQNIDFKGKEVSLRSQNPDDRETINATVIEAKDPYPTITFKNGEGKGVVLEGFTIRNELGHRAIHIEWSSPVVTNNIISGNTGGGIWCGRSHSPLIKNNVIGSNIVQNVGGGIECYLSSPIIENNTIANNKAGQGAGIHVWFSSPAILHNTIVRNEVRFDPTHTSYSYVGGGIFIDHFSIASVKDNVIHANYGGGIYLDSFSNALIAGNIITQNQAPGGGGIKMFLDCYPDIRNNVISGNLAERGAGIGVDFSCPIIAHNTIADNIADVEGSGIACYSKSTIFIINTILWNESDDIYLDEFSEAIVTYSDVRYGWPGEGNISKDPHFIGAGDYHLHPSSPCIDKGTAAGVYADIDGDIRPQREAFDIGADEYADQG